MIKRCAHTCVIYYLPNLYRTLSWNIRERGSTGPLASPTVVKFFSRISESINAFSRLRLISLYAYHESVMQHTIVPLPPPYDGLVQINAYEYQTKSNSCFCHFGDIFTPCQGFPSKECEKTPRNYSKYDVKPKSAFLYEKRGSTCLRQPTCSFCISTIICA